MKRYLLLASVAGCLLNVGNVWATDHDYDGAKSGEVQVSVTLRTVGQWGVNDVDFGEILLDPSVRDGDTIATFTNGELSYTAGKTLKHTEGTSGSIALSGMADSVTGVTFSPTTVDLLNASDNVVAHMTDIAPSAKTTVPIGRGGDNETGYFINGRLVVQDTNAEGTLTGVTTVTLQF